MSRRLASAIIDYLGTLPLVGGDHDGELFEPLPWERRFVRGAFGGAKPHDAALSLARGNGKSALVAGLGCAVVDPRGPLHAARREVVCTASSFAQARIILEDAKYALMELHGGLPRSEWRVSDNTTLAAIEHKASGSRIRVIGSDAQRAHGLRAALALWDEPAQFPAGSADKMLAALRTGLGKVPGSRMIVLGTRPGSANHWFEKMLHNETIYAQSHETEPDAPLTMREVRRANPSLDHLPSLKARIVEELREARHDPAALVTFRALRMNGGVSDTIIANLVDAEHWHEGAAGHEGPYSLGPRPRHVARDVCGRGVLASHGRAGRDRNLPQHTRPRGAWAARRRRQSLRRDECARRAAAARRARGLYRGPAR